MGMAARPVGRGRLAVRTMLSLEPWTIRGCGYPNLLATGEICERDSIHDRQHPHDLFMEVAAEYDRPLAGTVRWQIYGGPAGEPALGPAAFPHRLSAFPNPIAPIAHHWLDSTHITFGLVTAGVYDRRWKIETSVFNGREPDSTRTNFDLDRFDSIAGRVSLNPTDRLALQVSAGHLHDAEAGIGSQPRNSADRATASASYHRPLRGSGVWATTLAWGVNAKTSAIPAGLLSQTTHAVLLETSAMPNTRHTWFGRIEIVGKPAHDLHAHEYITRVFIVGKLQAGYIRHLRSWKGLVPGAGASVQTIIVPSLLAQRYRGTFAPGVGVFLAVQPTRQGM